MSQTIEWGVTCAVDLLMLDMGFTEKEIPTWKLQNLFPSVQDR